MRNYRKADYRYDTYDTRAESEGTSVLFCMG